MRFIKLVRKLLGIKSLVKTINSNRSLLLVLSFPIKIIDILFVRPKNEILFYGYNGRYNGNSSSLYRYCLSKKNQLRPIWLLDKQDLNQFGNSKNCFLLPCKNSNILDHIKLLLKIAHARVVVVASVGDLRFYCSLLYSKKRIEVLLFHGITVKAMGVMAKHLTKKQKNIWRTHPSRFDLISVSSSVEKYWVSSGFNINPDKVQILGMQRNDKFNINLSKNENLTIDSLFSQLGIDRNNIDIAKFSCVLYAPTHRDHSSTQQITMLENIDKYNIKTLNEFLKSENIFLFLREHAISDVNNLNNDNQLLESNIINCSASIIPSIENYLQYFDTIITDYSGIYLEYLSSKKSLAFALFDIDDQKRNRGLILPDEILFPGYVFSSQQELIYYLKNRPAIDKDYQAQRSFLNSLLFEKGGGGACKRTLLEINKIGGFS